MKKHKFKCKICGEEFRYVTNVLNHIAKTHKIDKNERESFLEREVRKGSKYLENKEIILERARNVMENRGKIKEKRKYNVLLRKSNN